MLVADFAVVVAVAIVETCLAHAALPMVPASASILPSGPNGNLAPQHIKAGLFERSRYACRTWATIAQAARLPVDFVKALLNNNDKGVTGIYAQWQMFEEKREAVLAIETQVAEIV